MTSRLVVGYVRISPSPKSTSGRLDISKFCSEKRDAEIASAVASCLWAPIVTTTAQNFKKRILSFIAPSPNFNYQTLDRHHLHHGRNAHIARLVISPNF